ncbi:MAG: sulfur carrier protein ThiS [Syntrophobacteraceae bacterium]|nr:sulfur carrier protein ThiS [Desulfobacteraceae bacterium]
MRITVNGETKDVPSPMTVGELLRSLGIAPASVAVERNLAIVPRSAVGMEPVCGGDSIEIIRMVGGG